MIRRAGAWVYIHLMLGSGAALILLSLALALLGGGEFWFIAWAISILIFGLALVMLSLCARTNIKYNMEVYRRHSLGFYTLLLSGMSSVVAAPISGILTLVLFFGLLLGAYIVGFYTPIGFRTVYRT